jgi:hypothetical protein
VKTKVKLIIAILVVGGIGILVYCNRPESVEHLQQRLFEDMKRFDEDTAKREAHTSEFYLNQNNERQARRHGSMAKAYLEMSQAKSEEERNGIKIRLNEALQRNGFEPIP